VRVRAYFARIAKFAGEVS